MPFQNFVLKKPYFLDAVNFINGPFRVSDVIDAIVQPQHTLQSSLEGTGQAE